MPNDKSSDLAIVVRDYNGARHWSVTAVQERYRSLCQQLGMESQAVPEPRQHQEGKVRWIFPIMDAVIQGIARGDLACIELGLEFIEQDEHFPFGKTLKSDTARALRRAPLSEDQKERIRKRVTELFVAGKIPHEFREYAKLLRRVGFEGWWPKMQTGARSDNPYVRRFYEYFRAAMKQGEGK